MKRKEIGIKKGIAYVLIANLINLVISLFSGFILPKLLEIDTYANIKLFQLYITYIGILHLGFSDGMYLRLGGKKIDDIDQKTASDEFFTFKLFQFLVTIIAIWVSIILKNNILLLCSLVILPINVGSYVRQLYQATGRFDLYSKFMNINTIMIFIINLFLVFVIKSNNYYLYIGGYIIAYLIYWLYIEIEIRKAIIYKNKTFNFKILKDDIKTGFFLMIGNFCNVIFTSIDRLFVKNILGMLKFATYSFAVSIEVLLNIFITPISTVMYNYLCNNRNNDQIKKIKKIIILFAAILIVLIYPAKFVIDNWITKYRDATIILFLLFAAQYITINVKCIHINLYKATKKQKVYFAKMLFIIGLSIILNILFYQLLNSIEAFALATLTTSIIWYILGEIDFKEFRLSFEEYLYLVLVLIVFLITGRIENVFIGLLLYLITVISLTFVLMRDTFSYCLNELKKIINRKKKVIR